MANIQTVSACIVTFNSDIERLRETIGSLLESFTFCENISPYRLKALYIVDNASSKTYRKRVSALLSDIRGALSVNTILVPIQLEKNIGFGAAHNIAISRTDAEFHMIVNPDLKFPRKSISSGLIAFERHPQVSMVAPSIELNGEQLGLHNRFYSAAQILLKVITGFISETLRKRLTNRLADIQPNMPLGGKCRYLFSGCLMLFRTAPLKSINGFNERYFLYFEDYELSLWFLEKNTGIISSEFQVEHYGGNTSRKTLSHWKMFLKSYFRFAFCRHAGRDIYFPAGPQPSE